MRRFVSKGERLRRLEQRLERVEALLTQPTPPPLPGQQTAFNVATISDHTYRGPGPCQEHTFTVRCGAHRDAHQHTDEM